MSNVYARDRATTTLETINVARELSGEIYKLIMNDAKIPKKHRYFIGKSLYTISDKIIENLYRANNIYPRSKTDLELRLSYQNISLQECALLMNMLELYSQILTQLSYKDMEKYANLATRVKQLLTNWIKSDKEQFKNLSE